MFFALRLLPFPPTEKGREDRPLADFFGDWTPTGADDARADSLRLLSSPSSRRSLLRPLTPLTLLFLLSSSLSSPATLPPPPLSPMPSLPPPPPPSTYVPGRYHMSSHPRSAPPSVMSLACKEKKMREREVRREGGRRTSVRRRVCGDECAEGGTLPVSLPLSGGPDPTSPASPENGEKKDANREGNNRTERL